MSGEPEPTIEELIERSSLGTPGAKALRARTPPETAADIVARAAEQPAYRTPVQPPHGWEGRQVRHFDPPRKIAIPGAFSAKVVGLTYAPGYPHNLHTLAALRGSSEEPRIILRHNPENPFDTNAVEVRAQEPGGDFVLLGHLPRAVAPRVAAGLDDGQGWEVTGYEVLEDPRHPNKPGLSIKVQRFTFDD